MDGNESEAAVAEASVVAADVAARTYAQSIRTFIPNEQHQLLIQDAVQRMHRIKLLAAEFLAHHVNRCLDKGCTLPEVTQTWARALFMHASHIPTDAAADTSAQSDQAMDADAAPPLDASVEAIDADAAQAPFDPSVEATIAELERTRQYDRPSRSGLSQMLSAEATVLASNFATNVKTHYKKRVFKFVRWSFKPEYRLPEEEHLRLKAAIALIAADLCRHGREPLESPSEYHAWVEQYRRFFGLDALLATEGLAHRLDEQPHSFIRSMRLMSRALEGSGGKPFALVPLTTTLRPGFVGFDTVSVGEVLHLGRTASAKQKQKAQQIKREADRAAGTYLSPKERHAQKATEREAQKAAARVAREERRVQDAKLSTAERAAVRKRRREEAQEHAVEQRAAKLAKRAHDYDSKREFYAGFTHIRVRPARGFVFSHSFRTDGVSVRLLFERERYERPERLSSLPKRGLFAVDQLKALSRVPVEQMQVLGIDPGMVDLINCVDPERLLAPSDPARPANVVYTAARRRHETCQLLYAQKLKAEKREREELAASEQEMGRGCKRSTDRKVLSAYFDARRGALLDFYGQMVYRVRRWRSFGKQQRSMHALIDRIKSMQTRSAMVLAYGSGVQAISTLRPRGIAPCINMKLRRRLSQHFVVADTPEPYTSKTCSKCLCSCGPLEELEKERRAEKLRVAKTEKEKKRASHYQIRGLRRCHNAECGVILHRDRNAACNIATTLRRLLSGGTCLGRPSTSEAEVASAMAWVDN